MNHSIIERVVNALMYEGYMLYPYRRSSVKNQRRWNFGVIHPAGMQPDEMKIETLLEGPVDTPVNISVRFLQPQGADSDPDVVERRLNIDSCGAHPFGFDELIGLVTLTRKTLRPGLEHLRLEIANRTPQIPNRDFLQRSMVSTHTVLTTEGNGAFVSLLDPSESLREAAAACRNVGAWPVLAGEETSRHSMIASPIILPDYPRAADESPQDLYDSTEIDEILTLRILTLSDAEKDEIRRHGGREQSLLERVESLTPEELSKLHGAFRAAPELRPGDRVRIRPRGNADIIDVALAGRIAVVESIEQDYENRTHVAVIVEDDPGRDLGATGQPGHRFFFSSNELERVA